MKKFFRFTFFLFAMGSFLWANLSDELGEYSFSDLACGFSREQVLAIPPVIARSILNSMALSVDVSKYGLDSLGVSDEVVASQGGDVAVRIYTVAKKVGGGALGPGIMLIHGGAWIAGNLETHDNISRFLCLKTGFPVVSVAYGVAPESTFPRAINQCKDVIAWMKRSTDLLCVDPERIAIVGDSAGGNIAAGLCLAVKDSEDLSVARVCPQF
jgi:acetyl esterase